MNGAWRTAGHPPGVPHFSSSQAGSELFVLQMQQLLAGGFMGVCQVDRTYLIPLWVQNQGMCTGAYV